MLRLERTSESARIDGVNAPGPVRETGAGERVRARAGMAFAVVLPVCNEEACLGAVLDELAAETSGQDARFIPVVGLNGTTDRSRDIALARGVLVGETAERGYGHGCMAAIRRLEERETEVDAYLFFAGDGADRPGDLRRLIDEYAKGADLVIGNRTLKLSNWKFKGSRRAFPNVTLAAVTTLLTGRLFYDLGPLRLIDRALFERMKMRELRWGWTVEAQIMAARLGARIANIHVEERPRLAGEQKVSGVTLRRSLGIGFAILAAAWRVRWRKL